MTTFLLIIILIISAIKDIVEKSNEGSIYEVFKKRWFYYLLLGIFTVLSFIKEKSNQADQDYLKDTITTLNSRHHRTDSIDSLRYTALQINIKDIKSAIYKQGFQYDSLHKSLVLLPYKIEELREKKALQQRMDSFNVLQNKKEREEQANVDAERIKNFNYWQNEVKMANQALGYDKTRLKKAQSKKTQWNYTTSDKELDVLSIYNQMIRDSSVVYRYTDSVKKYVK